MSATIAPTAATRSRTTTTGFAPHDLVRLRDGARPIRTAGVELPGWVVDQLTGPDPTWVVVRRDARAAPGSVPVGWRGASRAQRWGGLVREADVTERVDPWRIRTRPLGHERAALPPFVALAALAPVLDRELPGAWGPVGSVGYELVTGRRVVRTDSDLDLVVAAARPWSVEDGLRLRALLTQAPGATRVDVQMQAPGGGFSLGEWLRSPGCVALRTAAGPVLVDDPWAPPGATS